VEKKSCKRGRFHRIGATGVANCCARPSRSLLPSLTELRANRQVRRNLLTWVELMGLKPAAHHKLLIHALQETAEGKIDRFAARIYDH